MPDVEFTFLADQDIENIVRYTVSKWGTEQARRYISTLDQHFDSLTKGLVLTRLVFKHRPDIHSSRCQKHIVFHQIRRDQPPLIIAVLHSQMDLLVRLKDRI